MAQNEWEQRARRAEELSGIYGYAIEVLRFYAVLARFQGELLQEFAVLIAGSSSPNRDVRHSEIRLHAHLLPAQVAQPFARFLKLVEQNGPETLQTAAGELRKLPTDAIVELLRTSWKESARTPTATAQEFFPRAFLQPYAVALRLKSRHDDLALGATPFICPYCERKPGLGVLRPLGEGAQRSLICSFCLKEWNFRRILCPGCGEEDYAKLPVYTAGDVENVRLEACESCRTYIKTVDMTKSGRAEPIVDEIAAIPLDLWAREQGYAKLAPNLLQL
jgi:formate dehydrogenase accessory protein FdhE